jgi:hypothetical protein
MKAFSPGYADWQVPVTYRAITSTKAVKPVLESNSVKPPQ